MVVTMEVATTSGGRDGAVMALHMVTEVVVVELAMVVGKTKTVTLLGVVMIKWVCSQFCMKQHTREIISARNTSHKHKKDLNRLR